MLTNRKIVKLLMIACILTVILNENTFFDNLVSGKINVTLSIISIVYFNMYDRVIGLLFTILFLTSLIKYEYHQNSLYVNH